MYYGLLALLTRALREDSRRMLNHLFRLAFVCFIYFFMIVATIQGLSKGAPGLDFFKAIALLNLLFVTCAGIGFFSSAITEEKEEETIGLLQMAGLNHLAILLGKSTNRLIIVALLLIVQFPFMLLSVTLGGVTTHQIIAAYVDLLAYTVLLANTALLCSVMFQRGGTAAAFTTLLTLLYVVAAKVAELELAELKTMGLTKSSGWSSALITTLEWLQSSCVLFELDKVMTTGFAEPILTKQVISNVVGGLVFFGLSWLLFGPLVHDAAPGGVTRGVVTRSSGRMRMFSPGRCWGNPLAWKDFQFIGGGYMYSVIKLLFYFGIFGAIAGISLYDEDWLGYNFSNIGEIFVICMSVALFIEACVYASRIFHDEIRLQTMSSLLMLPRSIPYIGYSKALGCLLGLAPVTFCLVVGALTLPAVTPESVLAVALDARLWAAIMALLIFLHLIALLSLFIKWGAVPAAIFLSGPMGMCCPVYQLTFLILTPNSGLTDVWGKLPATITVWILTGLVCFVFQMMIAARLQELGTR